MTHTKTSQPVNNVHPQNRDYDSLLADKTKELQWLVNKNSFYTYRIKDYATFLLNIIPASERTWLPIAWRDDIQFFTDKQKEHYGHCLKSYNELIQWWSDNKAIYIPSTTHHQNIEYFKMVEQEKRHFNALKRRNTCPSVHEFTTLYSNYRTFIKFFQREKDINFETFSKRVYQHLAITSLNQNINTLFRLSDEIADLRHDSILLAHEIQTIERQYPSSQFQRKRTGRTAPLDVPDRLKALRTKWSDIVNNQYIQQYEQIRTVEEIIALISHRTNNILSVNLEDYLLQHDEIKVILNTLDQGYQRLEPLLKKPDFYKHQTARHRDKLLQSVYARGEKVELSPIIKLINSPQHEIQGNKEAKEQSKQDNCFKQLIMWWDQFQPILNMIAQYIPTDNSSHTAIQHFETLGTLEQTLVELEAMLQRPTASNTIFQELIQFMEQHRELRDLWSSIANQPKPSLSSITNIIEPIIRSHNFLFLAANTTNRLAATLYHYFNTTAHEDKIVYYNKISALIEEYQSRFDKEPVHSDEEEFLARTKQWYTLAIIKTPSDQQELTLQGCTALLKGYMHRMLDPAQKRFIDEINELRRETTNALAAESEKNISLRNPTGFFKQEKQTGQLPQAKPKLRLIIP